MTAITFDSTTVDSIEVTRIVQLGTLKFECTVACQTVTYANYTALVAKAGLVGKSVCWPSGKVSIQSIGGTKGDLVLNGATYTNCYIEEISAAEAPNSVLGVWHFTISFVKDTSL